MALSRRDYIRRTKRAFEDRMQKVFAKRTPSIKLAAETFDAFFKSWPKHPRVGFRLTTNVDPKDANAVPTVFQLQIFDSLAEEYAKAERDRQSQLSTASLMGAEPTTASSP